MSEVSNNLKIPFVECFYSIQGEGVFAGVPAYFIRLAGCDVGCHWCDVKDSWSMDFPFLNLQKVLDDLKSNNCKTVIITGGEPLLHDLDFLTKKLKENGLRTHIETSGSSDFSGDWDWVCLSPKKPKLPLLENYKFANELKVIIYNNNDFVFAEKEAKKVDETCKLLLQVEWSRTDKMLDETIDFVKKNPKWRLSVQIHKYIGVE